MRFYTWLAASVEWGAFKERWDGEPGMYLFFAFHSLRYARLTIGHVELAVLTDGLDLPPPEVPTTPYPTACPPPGKPPLPSACAGVFVHHDHWCHRAALFTDTARTRCIDTAVCDSATRPHRATNTGEIDKTGRKVFVAHPNALALLLVEQVNGRLAHTANRPLYTPQHKFESALTGAGCVTEQQRDKDQQEFEQRNAELEQYRERKRLKQLWWKAQDEQREEAVAR